MLAWGLFNGRGGAMVQEYREADVIACSSKFCKQARESFSRPWRDSVVCYVYPALKLTRGTDGT